VTDLYETLLEMLTQLNRPRFHALLLERAGVSLDRALFPLLSRIDLAGPLGVVELAEAVKLSHSTVSRQVMKLESLGLVERRPSVKDNRVREAALTDEGRQMLTTIKQARKRGLDEALADWTDDERAQLAAGLRHFVQSVRAYTETQPSSHSDSPENPAH
jgi:DNA-binding MarR family transcriptional regulator